jgi:hypothetical protein
MLLIHQSSIRAIVNTIHPSHYIDSKTPLPGFVATPAQKSGQQLLGDLLPKNPARINREKRAGNLY